MKKTKKALLAALACSAALAGAVGLAACSGGNGDKHEHKWGGWTVASQPTNDATGKASRACTGEGTCDAAATEKEATLPVLTSTDYTKGEDTATCQAAGSVTYTYNKGGVNVSFNVATPINAEKHTDTCGHNTPAPTAHSHVWSEWTVNDAAKQGYIGEATRTCTGAGTCDADESLTVVTIPSVLWGEDYTYAEPVVKSESTCLTQGVKTYTYTDTEKGISVSFDVTTSGYGEHKIVGNECEVCHASVVTAVLDNEVTINATSEKATILAFTAEKAGTYRIVYTQGEGANVDDNTSSFPASVTLAAGETATFAIKSPVDNDNPDTPTSATYKIKVFAITELSPEYDYDNDEYVPSTATVNVGGDKTAILKVNGQMMMAGGSAVISYYGNNNLTFTYELYELGQYNEYSFTLGGMEMSKTLEFGMYSNSLTFTVSSDAEEVNEEEISYLFVESEKGPEFELGEEKEFEDLDSEGATYNIYILDSGNYTITTRGDAFDFNKVSLVVRADADDETSVINANEDGIYELTGDTTYYVIVKCTDPDGLSGFGAFSIEKAVECPVIEVGVAVDVDNDGMENSLYKIEIAENGNYTISFTGFEATVVIVTVGTGFDGYYVNGDVDPNDGVYALDAGTYYISIINNNYSSFEAWLPDPISGTMTVSKV